MYIYIYIYIYICIERERHTHIHILIYMFNCKHCRPAAAGAPQGSAPETKNEHK